MIARDGQTRNQAQARWAVVVAREGIGTRAQALPVVRGSEEHRPEAQGFETHMRPLLHFPGECAEEHRPEAQGFETSWPQSSM